MYARGQRQVWASLDSHISESLQRFLLKLHGLTKFGTIHRFTKSNFCFNEEHKMIAILRDIVEKVDCYFCLLQSAILDGIDLDIEDHKSGGYAQLVKNLRQLEKTAGAKRYLITGAPQCPFPDASLGPEAGTALGDQGAQFDHVYVQFYNNFCHTGDQAQFYPNMDKWLQFAASTKRANDFAMVLKNRKRGMGDGPKIFIGMPSATGGAEYPKFYRTPKEVEKIYEV